MRITKGWLFVCFGLLSSVVAANSKETRLMRFPDISRDQAAFVYAGDLWTVPRAGGQARRLTAHPGDELFPKFSPDGKWIAFTGEAPSSRPAVALDIEPDRILTIWPTNQDRTTSKRQRRESSTTPASGFPCVAAANLTAAGPWSARVHVAVLGSHDDDFG